MKSIGCLVAAALALPVVAGELPVPKNIKAYDIDFNWGPGGPNGFAKPGLWADADPAKHMAWYKEMGVNAIQTFCVSCNGYAWYKNGVVPEQPGLKHDFLPEMVKLAHKEGILVLGYFCAGSNTKWGLEHPDLSYGVPSAPHIPYTDAYLSYLDSAIRDAVAKTGMDGFMLDWLRMPTTRASNGGHWLDCEKKLYAQLMGEPFPGEQELPQAKMTEYGRRAVDRCWQTIRRAAKETHPDCIVWLTCCDVDDPHIVDSRALRETDWLLNEAGDTKRTADAKRMIGPQTRLITCLANWNGQDPLKIVPAAQAEGIGLYGFTKPGPDSLVPLDDILSRSVNDLKGDQKNIAVLARAFHGVSLSPTAAAFDPLAALDRYNVVWNSPSADQHGSMPLGNGDIGLNAWALSDGTLHLLVSKTDAWDDNARLVKVGEVVVRFAPNLFAGTFRQELDLKTGSIVLQDNIRLWVDANQPVIHLTTDLPIAVGVELWRTNRHEIAQLECSDVMLNRSKPGQKEAPMFVEPDTVVENRLGRTTWYHHNATSVGPEITARIQGVTGFKQPDPILRRTFGATVVRSPHGVDIYVLTQQPSTPERWRNAMTELIRRAGAPDFNAHKAWWAAFWSRSWIRATSNADATRSAATLIPSNSHPLRVGEDQTGHGKFAGGLRNASVVTNATGSVTFAAEVNPSAGEKGRIFDKITPGGADGFLLDAYPGNSLRLISGSTQANAKDALPAGQWARVEAVADAAAGGWRVSVNGKVVLDSTGVCVADEAAYVSQMAALQRFVTACAGRGAYPIKFNGSIFTVAPDEKRDHDYRRWGPGYWWQNTRLPYLSMCAAGDFEMMRPLFKMYAEDLLPLCKYRTKLYCGHDGAFYPECIYFWGAMFSETYGWTPFEQRSDKLQESRWHKWEWVGGLELCWFLLDYYDYTLDRAFLDKTALPFCREILTFFDQHYKTGADGKLVMCPAQALETWWECTNAMPEVAGCIAVADRLLLLPDTPASERAFLQQFRAKLPPLPLREIDGRLTLAPAEKFSMKRNCENPELYAVFPFRLVALGKPNCDWGVEALKRRQDKGDFGWRQDDLFMAYLGLAEDARRNIVNRAKRHDKKERFPAFWGPNYDWTPDQDHGGVLAKGVQSLLLQTDGRKIYLLPAWPRDWDCTFKLHAPFQTVITGTVKDGKLAAWDVTPAARKADVVIAARQEHDDVARASRP